MRISHVVRKRAILWMIVSIVGVSSRVAAIDLTQNQIGRMTSVGRANGQMRTYMEYDALGRTTATLYEQDGAARTCRKSFIYPQSSAGATGPGTVIGQELILEGDPDAEIVTNLYDAGGEVVRITTSFRGTTATIVDEIRRNSRGQTTLIRYGDGTVTTQAYNDQSDLRLQSIVTQSGAETLQHYDYAFDPNGNVTGLADRVVAELSSTYTYDELDQLTSLNGPGIAEPYEYDLVGNLTRKGTTGQTYGGEGRGPHALATSGGVTYRYDAAGNVTEFGADGSPITSLTWNAQHMPVLQTGVATIARSYVGEQVWKQVESSGTTYYLPNVRIENGRARKFFGRYAERSAEDDELRFYHPDHLGSSTLVTMAGRQVRRIGFFPWGENRDPLNESFSFLPKYQFNFRERLQNGLYDYGARLYNPATGRWLSPDDDLTDAIEDGQLNRYAYVSNNPVTFTDPTGHCKGIWDCGKEFLKGAGDAVVGMAQTVALVARAHNGDALAGAELAQGIHGQLKTAYNFYRQEGPSGFYKGVKALDARSWGNLTVQVAVSVTPAKAVAVPISRAIVRTGARVGIRTSATTAPAAAARVPSTPRVPAGTRRALPAPRQIDASWGASTYRRGGLLNGMEHIMHRHSAGSGFTNVGRFAEGTTARNIMGFVDDALRHGNVTQTGLGAFTVEHTLGRTIGTNATGQATNSIRVHVRDGIIQSAFPF